MSKKFVFKIDRDVPIPVYFRQPVYNLDKMKVGDSFRVPSDKVASLRVVVHKWKRRFPKQKFLVRIMNRRSYRCWRVA